jgi:hypothetical protein
LHLLPPEHQKSLKFLSKQGGYVIPRGVTQGQPNGTLPPSQTTWIQRGEEKAG